MPDAKPRVRADGLHLERSLGQVAVGCFVVVLDGREHLPAIVDLFLRARLLGWSAHIACISCELLLLLENRLLRLVGKP